MSFDDSEYYLIEKQVSDLGYSISWDHDLDKECSKLLITEKFTNQVVKERIETYDIEFDTEETIYEDYLKTISFLKNFLSQQKSRYC